MADPWTERGSADERGPRRPGPCPRAAGMAMAYKLINAVQSQVEGRQPAASGGVGPRRLPADRPQLLQLEEWNQPGLSGL
jgi:hypothetical protein